MEAPTTWGLVISGVLAIGSVLGVVLSRIGQKQDVEQRQVSDQFERMLNEVTYWRDSATRTREEWEARWDRQINRCRGITDRLAMTLALTAKDPAERASVEEVLGELRNHNSTDHRDARN